MCCTLKLPECHDTLAVPQRQRVAYLRMQTVVTVETAQPIMAHTTGLGLQTTIFLTAPKSICTLSFGQHQSPVPAATEQKDHSSNVQNLNPRHLEVGCRQAEVKQLWFASNALHLPAHLAPHAQA